METIPEGNTSTDLGIDYETLAYIEERAQNIIRYSDKLSQAIRILKISYRLRIGKEWGLYAANDIEEMDNDCLTDVSRAIKSDELIKIFSD